MHGRRYQYLRISSGMILVEIIPRFSSCQTSPIPVYHQAQSVPLKICGEDGGALSRLAEVSISGQAAEEEEKSRFRVS